MSEEPKKPSVPEEKSGRDSQPRNEEKSDTKPMESERDSPEPVILPMISLEVNQNSSSRSGLDFDVFQPTRDWSKRSKER